MSLQIKNMFLEKGGKSICRDLTLHLESGKIWGILGPNGCGKTTLLHALANLHPISAGEILLRASPMHTMSPRVIAQSVGILFQDFTASFPQTVWEYCLAGRYPHLQRWQKETALDKSIAREALQITALEHLSSRLINQLSGGEKRRLAIASLLTQTPDIFLLDEPSNHLDVRHQMQIMQHFRHLARNEKATVIMSMHDPNLAQRFCDALILLFPQQTHYGGKSSLLTADNLSDLYQHPMEAIESESGVYWQASMG